MTREEAKLVLDNARPQTEEIDKQFYDDEDLNNALDMAIKALKVGKWKKNEHTFWTCSECGLVNKYNRVQYAYCPNCGAEMEGGENG